MPHHAPSRPPLPRPITLGAALGALALLGGCAAPAGIEPGVDAKNPTCAQVIRATPEEMLGLERREASAQSATAWGTPAITVRCGVEVPGPTTDRCLSIDLPDGTTMDWINPEAQAVEGDTDPSSATDGGSWTFVTYGRDPAIEVTVPAGAGLDQPTAVLVELAPALALVPATRSCVGATDVGA